MLLWAALLSYSFALPAMDSINNYVFYGGEKYNKQLEKYDLVITAPGFNKKYVKKLHRKGVHVIATVTRSDSIGFLQYLVDENRFDGFFFVLNPSETLFVRMVREKFPDKILIISTDVIGIEPFVDYIDGFLWKFLSTEFRESRYMVKTDINRIKRENYLAINIINRLRRYRKKFKAFALDVITIPDSITVRACYVRAAKLDFIEYVGTPALNIVIPPPSDTSIKVDMEYAYNFDPVFKLPSQIASERDTSDENIALARNGARAGYDSQAAWADVSVVNDGYINDPGIAWIIPINWATGSDSTGHYLEITLPDEYYLDSVKIYWPIVNGVPLSPRRYRLEAQSSERPFWWPMIVATDSRPRKMDKFVFTEAYAGKVRIYIAPGDGPRNYPYQLWVSEIKVYGE